MRLTPDGRRESGRRDLVALALLVTWGLVLAGLSEEQNSAVTARLRATVLVPFLETHRTLDEHVRLSRRLDALRAQRDSLAGALLQARVRAEGARRLRSLLGLEEAPEGGVLPADLEPGRSRLGGVRSFALRAGTERGLRAPAGVFTEDGLVGVVRWVGSGEAHGDFWTHPDFRVSVRTETGEATGIVRPSYEAGQPVMLLEGAPYQTEIPEGTVLYTTGVGGVFPPGIRVGTVRDVSGVESGWERSYRVAAAVRPGQVDVALVWLREEEGS